MMFYRIENDVVVGGPFNCNQEFPVVELGDDDPKVVAFESFKAAASIQGQINALESVQLLPRVTREFLIAQFVALATSHGLTKEQLLNPQDAAYAPGFAKVVAFDNEIKALRAKL